MPEFGLRKSEWLLVIIAVCLFALAGWLYFKGGGFLSDEKTEGGKRVGVLAEHRGTVRREVSGQNGFLPIAANADLFNEDTVVTAADSAARVELDDGSTIDLGPNAMVRLEYEKEFSLSGINRIPNVNVIAGQIIGRAKTRDIHVRSGGKLVSIAKSTAQALTVRKEKVELEAPRPISPASAPVPLASLEKSFALPVRVAAAPSPSPAPPPPVPSPSPLPEPVKVSQLSLFSPKPGARLSVPTGSTSASVPIVFEWKATPALFDCTLSIRNAGSEKPLFSQLVPKTASGSGKVTWSAEKPGKYVWEVKPVAGKFLKPENALRGFEVLSQFEGIELLEPLVGGQKHVSNQLKGRVLKDFDITLRWKPYPGIKTYRVELSKEPGGKAIMGREVEQPTLSLNHDKVFSGEIYYRISATTSRGFQVTSSPMPFRFRFLAPILTLPKEGSRNAPGRSGKLLMTWQKTNFTREYELEISRDPAFKDPVVKTKTTENFHVLNRPLTGDYFWRVRSRSGKVVSPMSPVWRFSVIDSKQLTAPKSHTGTPDPVVGPGTDVESDAAIVPGPVIPPSREGVPSLEPVQSP